MTIGQREKLDETLRRMADRVTTEPALGEELAHRALRGATRRRNTRIGVASVAVLGVAAAITTPLVLRGGEQRPVVTKPPVLTGHSGLPASTPAQLATVRACLKDDPGRGPAGPSRHPAGRVRDFRVLVSYHDANGAAVLLGSTRVYLTCSLERSGMPSPSDRHQFARGTEWDPSFATFPGQIDLEETGFQVLSTDKATEAERNRAGSEDHISGRVKPDVSRVTITFPGGAVKNAALSGGYFLWRIWRPGAADVKSKNVVVRAYDRNGTVVQTEYTTIGSEPG